MNVRGILRNENEIWAIEEDYNYLIKRNFDNDKTYLIRNLDLDGVCEKELYSSACINGDEIFIAPGKANSFLSYSIKKDELSQVGVIVDDEIAESAKGIIKFGEAYKFNDACLFLGISFPGFAYLDREEKNVDFYRLDDEIIEGMRGRILGRTGALIDDSLYVPVWRREILIKFDFSSKCISYIKINTSSQYVAAIMVKKEIWLLKYGDYSIDVINLDGLIIDTIDINKNAQLGNYDFHFYSGYYRKNSIWLVPLEEKRIIEIDINDRTIKSGFVVNNREGLTFVWATMQDDSNIYLLSRCDNRNCVLSDSNRIETLKFEPNFMPVLNHDTGLFYEDFFSLSSLISSMIGGEG